MRRALIFSAVLSLGLSIASAAEPAVDVMTRLRHILSEGRHEAGIEAPKAVAVAKVVKVAGSGELQGYGSLYASSNPDSQYFSGWLPLYGKIELKNADNSIQGFVVLDQEVFVAGFGHRGSGGVSGPETQEIAGKPELFYQGRKLQVPAITVPVKVWGMSRDWDASIYSRPEVSLEVALSEEGRTLNQAAPASQSAVCVLKDIVGHDCVYRCGDGREVRREIQLVLPNSPYDQVKYVCPGGGQITVSF
ncbi:MAG: hypothetical protein HY921_05305 [Elusimicrobia bacterium]|nr:hypothetical protein [Elusimicrobiota bacterium]